MNDKVENIATQTPPMAATYGPQYATLLHAVTVIVALHPPTLLYRNYCQICSINSTGKGQKGSWKASKSIVL
ncbi:hypothetical protein IFM89_030504, partial [Coptis chinensis]